MRCKYGGIEVARRNNGEEGRRRKKERGTVLNIENFQGEEFFFEKFFFRQSLKISSYLEELANFFLFLSFLIIILLSLSPKLDSCREREREEIVIELRLSSATNIKSPFLLSFPNFWEETRKRKRKRRRRRSSCRLSRISAEAESSTWNQITNPWKLGGGNRVPSIASHLSSRHFVLTLCSTQKTPTHATTSS